MEKRNRLGNALSDSLGKMYLHELVNQHIYDMISCYLDNLGLYHLSEYYAEWSQEEKNHADWVKDFMLSVGAMPPNGYELKVDKIDFVDMYTFVDKTVEREQLTTDMYNLCYETAMEENNGMAVNFIIGTMQKEQIEEENKASTLSDQIHHLKDMQALQRFDLSFKKDYY